MCVVTWTEASTNDYTTELYGCSCTCEKGSRIAEEVRHRHIQMFHIASAPHSPLAHYTLKVLQNYQWQMLIATTTPHPPPSNFIFKIICMQHQHCAFTKSCCLVPTWGKDIPEKWCWWTWQLQIISSPNRQKKWCVHIYSLHRNYSSPTALAQW